MKMNPKKDAEDPKSKDISSMRFSDGNTYYHNKIDKVKAIYNSSGEFIFFEQYGKPKE